ncbi:MAG: acyl-CoA desaturase [Acidimicrobiales bacterium]|nr:acyl-CoA desaturase [Acidimicrobiales bacterium]
MSTTTDATTATGPRPPSRGAPHLDEAQLDALAVELDAIRRREMADRGEADAAYIRRVATVATALQLGGRVAIALGRRRPRWWGGVLAATAGRVIEAMEIGHNVLHGQYDWMRDPRFDSSTYEWNMTAPSDQWQHAHNVVHHVNANVAGIDRDLGYGVVRITDDEPWRPAHLANPLAALLLAALFDQAIGFYDLEAERQALGLVDPDEARAKFEASMAKLRRQAARDFVLTPLLAGRAAPRALAGSLTTQLLGNLWGFAVIFCGHFPDGTVVFRPEDLDGETRGRWYVRQLRGAANIRGSFPFHVLTGNLSHQIEHHLFPDVPARRYRHIAPEVQAVCRRYGLPYNSRRFGRQFGSVAVRIVRLSLPGRPRSGLRRRRGGHGERPPRVRPGWPPRRRVRRPGAAGTRGARR